MLKSSGIKEALRALAGRPFTRETPSPKYRGHPTFNERCIGCGACAVVCPPRAIAISDNKTRMLVVDLGLCIFCGQCEACCPTGGIKLEPEFELSKTARDETVSKKELELVFCEVCGSPISARAHLEWIARRVGALAYSNPTLALTIEKDFIKETPKRTQPTLRRSDNIRLLCPSCRVDAILAEEWD